MAQEPQARILLNDLNQFLDEAETHLAKGGDIDLTGVEGQVKALCEAAQSLPVAEGAAFAGDLEALFARFTRLQEELQLQFASVKEALGSLSLRSKAARAYAVNDALTHPRKEKK